MTGLAHKLKQEFKSAPLWQKGVLVVLCAVIIYFFLLRPGLLFSEKKLQVLDNKRDIAFRQLQAARYFIADEKIISENYSDVRNQIAPALDSEKIFIEKLKRLFKKRSVKVYTIEMPDAGRMDFNGIEQLHVQAKVRLKPNDVRVIISEMADIPYGVLTSLDYRTSLGLIEADFLVNKNFPVKKIENPAVKPAFRARTTAPELVINGFFTSGTKKQVIINGRIFNVGGKYGPYTIISINPEAKNVKVSLGKKVIVKYYKKGKK